MLCVSASQLFIPSICKIKSIISCVKGRSVYNVTPPSSSLIVLKYGLLSENSGNSSNVPPIVCRSFFCSNRAALSIEIPDSTKAAIVRRTKKSNILFPFFLVTYKNALLIVPILLPPFSDVNFSERLYHNLPIWNQYEMCVKFKSSLIKKAPRLLESFFSVIDYFKLIINLIPCGCFMGINEYEISIA